MKLKKIFITIICSVMLVGIMLVLTGCNYKIAAAEISSDYSRKATATGEVTEQTKAAVADFSMKLFNGVITKDNENELFSPLSAILCLAMITNGAEGNTLSQLEELLGLDVSDLNTSLYAFVNSLFSSKECACYIANSIWFRDNDDGLTVNDEFLQTNADWYGAKVYSSDFGGSTVKDINEWCRRNTNGMIEKIIDSIDKDTIMYLINALTFEAKWAEKYEKKNIISDEFTNYDGTTTSVEMLCSTEYSYLTTKKAVGFKKDYSGNRYGIVALLPDVGYDIYDFIASFSGEEWQNMWKGKSSSMVTVRMPEFSYEATMPLNEPLNKLGVTDMFDGSRADFSKLGSYKDGNIFCSKVEQKTFIDVSRNGTKAAAITWGSIDKATSAAPEEPKYVILDRPFVYAIVDNATGLPLFLGAVTTL